MNCLKTISRKYIVATALVAAAFVPARVSAQFSLGDLLGRVAESLSSNTSGTGDALAGVIDGVFTKSDIKTEDVAGDWTVTGSAVDFRSEEFLKKAGGKAAAATIEQKIDPYYKKYGFENSTISITKDGELTMTVGKFTLKGTITPNDDKRYAGNFIVRFKALGVMSLGEYDTYVSLVANPLTGTRQLRMMFDARKLVAMIKCVAALSKKGLARSAVELLDQYEGVCVGFKCVPAPVSQKKDK